MIADRYRDYMYNLIDRVVREIGPRESCTPKERELADLLAAEWKPICDKVEMEEFTCAPTAFLGFLPIAVILYIGSVATYWLPSYFPVLSFVFAAVGFSMLVFEFVRYREMLDPWFPQRTGQNVYGVIKPSGEVKRRFIVSGHTDSAYEFNLWTFLKNAAIPVMVIGILGVILLVGASLAKAIAVFTGDPTLPIFRTLGIICVAIYPFVGTFLFFHTYTAVPGAMDDMAGVSIAAGLGRYLSEARKNGEFFPENTEVVIMGMGAEEAGLRGAKRYVQKHLGELKAIPSHGITFDGIYDEQFLVVMKSEVCTGAKHDKKLVRAIVDTAKSHGWPIKVASVPIGASDASAFSPKGVSFTCVACQDVTKFVPNYHSRFDTMEYIRPEALAVSLQLAIDMLQKIDRGEIS